MLIQASGVRRTRDTRESIGSARRAAANIHDTRYVFSIFFCVLDLVFFLTAIAVTVSWRNPAYAMRSRSSFFNFSSSFRLSCHDACDANTRSCTQTKTRTALNRKDRKPHLDAYRKHNQVLYRYANPLAGEKISTSSTDFGVLMRRESSRSQKYPRLLHDTYLERRWQHIRKHLQRHRKEKLHEGDQHECLKGNEATKATTRPGATIFRASTIRSTTRGKRTAIPVTFLDLVGYAATDMLFLYMQTKGRPRHLAP